MFVTFFRSIFLHKLLFWKSKLSVTLFLFVHMSCKSPVTSSHLCFYVTKPCSISVVVCITSVHLSVLSHSSKYKTTAYKVYLCSGEVFCLSSVFYQSLQHVWGYIECSRPPISVPEVALALCLSLPEVTLSCSSPFPSHTLILIIFSQFMCSKFPPSPNTIVQDISTVFLSTAIGSRYISPLVSNSAGSQLGNSGTEK